MDSRAFIERLSSPILSLSALASLLLSPLNALSLLSPSIQRRYLDSQPESFSFTSQNLKSSLIPDVQRLILTKVLVDWSDVLQEEEEKIKRKRRGKGKGKSKRVEDQEDDEDTSLLEVILQGWFYPSFEREYVESLKSTKDLTSTQTLKRASKAKVCISSLRVCSSLLSSKAASIQSKDGRKSGDLHFLSSKYLLEVLVQYQRRVHVGLLLEGALDEKNEAQKKLTWEDTVKNLVALPDKVANFTQGKAPGPLEKDCYLSNLSFQLASTVSFLSSSNSDRMESLDSLSSLLSKLIRTGFVSSVPPYIGTQSTPPNFWSSLLRSVISQANFTSNSQGLWPVSYQSTWQSLLSRLSEAERITLCKSLVYFLDRHSLIRNSSSSIIAPNEVGKAGRAGSSFLSSESRERAGLVAEILNLFFSKRSDGSPSGESRQNQTKRSPEMDRDSESDSDDENEEGHLDSTLTEVIMPRGKELGLIGSPLLARSISLWVFKQSRNQCLGKENSDPFVETFFNRFVSIWSNPARIRTTSLSQEEYLTTLFLSLLCHLRALESRSSSASTFLNNISHLPSFLNGVSSHLDHLDPTIRRLGMLIAEVMSSFTSTSSPQNGAKVKKLDFGKSVWDGLGQGKEEARVLRALVDGWKLHDPSTSNKCWDKEEMIQISGIAMRCEEQEIQAPEAVEVISSSKIQSINEKKSRPKPRTRTLPAKVPAPSRTTPTSAPASEDLPSLFPINRASNNRSLIKTLDDSEHDIHSDSSSSLQAYEDRSSDSSSSSYEDTSDSESDRDGIAEQMGSALGLDAEGLKRAREATGGDKENKSGLDPGVPKKKRKLPPVYVADLIPLLKANDREDNRTGLKNATALIERKARWGGEVDENAVQLAYALCGLGDNWRIKDFEKRRTSALTALIVASPRIATGSVIEQYFTHQYSTAQRCAMLDALASASRNLAGLSPLFEDQPGSKDRKIFKTASAAANSIAEAAMKRAREDGEGHVPSIAREKSLTLNPRLQTSKTVQEINSPVESRPHVSRRGFTDSVRPKERYIDLAGSIFIFPLIQRFRSHLQDASMRSRRAHSNDRQGYGGAGTATLLSPMMISRFLDSLSVTVHASRNSLDFLAVIVPEVLELVLGVSTEGVKVGLRSTSLSNASEDLESEGQGGDVISTINSSLAGLALTVLDSSWEIERSKTLRNYHIQLVGRIGQWAAEAFEREETRNKGSGLERTLSGRAARVSAAVVLRVAEIRGEWNEKMIGF